MPAPLSVLAAPLGPNIVLCNLTLKFTSNIYFCKITWNLLNKFIKKIENFVQLNNILFYLTIVLLNHSQNVHYYEWILVQLIISPIDTTPISLICTCCGIGVAKEADIRELGSRQGSGGFLGSCYSDVRFMFLVIYIRKQQVWLHHPFILEIDELLHRKGF